MDFCQNRISHQTQPIRFPGQAQAGLLENLPGGLALGHLWFPASDGIVTFPGKLKGMDHSFSCPDAKKEEKRKTQHDALAPTCFARFPRAFRALSARFREDGVMRRSGKETPQQKRAKALLKLRAARVSEKIASAGDLAGDSGGHKQLGLSEFKVEWVLLCR